MSSDEKKKPLPKDIQVIKSIMNELDIKEYDESVIQHLLGFNYSKCSTII